MRKTTFLLGSAMLMALAYTPAALAGGGFGGDPATGKISGPAVSATMVVDPTAGSPTLGDSAIRLAKGTAQAGSLFVNREARAGSGWVMGCDGVQGAAAPGGTANVVALTQLRFVNNRMRAYVPPGVLAGLFAQLGITIDDVQHIPVITDVDNAVCTRVEDSDGVKFMLSFTAVVQFENSIK